MPLQFCWRWRQLNLDEVLIAMLQIADLLIGVAVGRWLVEEAVQSKLVTGIVQDPVGVDEWYFAVVLAVELVYSAAWDMRG